MITSIQAILFDLDGVLTDTAEYHYLAWKRLADELGVPFRREDNEHLRGVPRRESLEFILNLGKRTVSKSVKQELMARKNGYYRQYLKAITPADLLPGAMPLLEEIRAAGLKIGVASASNNSQQVLESLGICDQIDALAHGGSVARQKPHPDLFLYVAERLGLSPASCLVVEDAAAGIAAAQAAGMATVGLGPEERVGAADLVLPGLDGISLEALLRPALWRVAEAAFRPEDQLRHETIFTIGNGYLGTRGSLEERIAGDRQATFIHGIYDDRPVVFTELANAPDWTALELWVDGRRFSMAEGTVAGYARWLNLRTGALHRRLRWTPAPDAAPVEISFTRLADLSDEHALALRVTVTPLGRGSASGEAARMYHGRTRPPHHAPAPEKAVSVRVRAKLDGQVENMGFLHWKQESEHSTPHQASLAVRTRRTDKIVALGQRLSVAGADAEFFASDCTGCPGIEAVFSLAPGETATLDKFVAVYTSRDTHEPLRAAENRAAETAQRGFPELMRRNREAWDAFWAASDVIIEGDAEAQLALRHGLFQLRIAAPTHDERVSIGAKTLSGLGYAGHIFWDNEIFVLPFFTFTQPKLARNMLRYRFHTLPGARKKAAANGFGGAQYAWESAEIGEEVTPTWVPDANDRIKLVRIWTGDIQLHISADVAYAMHQYWQVTGDDEFWRDTAIPVILETAVFWGERAEPEPGGRFCIRNVIGGDEYHDHVDDNAFTNAMVRWHLHLGLEALDWLADHAPEKIAEHEARLGLTDERLAHWRAVIKGLVIHHDPETGLIEQFEGFYGLKDVDWPAFAGRTESMQALLGIEGINEYKVLKQADVLALLALLGDEYDEKTWQANWNYYAPITDHEYGSSLGPAMHAWVAGRLGQPEVAYQHFLRAARADLADIRGNAAEGIHAASAGGLWEAVVFGFAGLKITNGGLTTAPRLPSHWRRLAFSVQHCGTTKHFDFRREGGERMTLA